MSVVLGAVALVLFVSDRGAQAGVGSWTSNGPTGGAIYSMAVDPSNGDNVFVGTETGVFRSTDGGRSWIPSDKGFGSGVVNGLTISDDGRRVLAAVNSSVYRSDDGGATWRGVSVPNPSSRLYSIAMTPGNPESVVVSTLLNIMKSNDGGGSWHVATIHGDNPAHQGVGFVFNRSVPGEVYVAAGDVFKSTDDGETWSGFGYVGNATAVTIDPEHPSTVIWGDLGGGGLWRTSDWKQAFPSDTGIPRYPIGYCAACTNPIVSLAADSTGGRLFVAIVGDGVFRSTDGGLNWAPWSIGLTSDSVFSLASAPPASGDVFVGTLGAGVFRLPNASAEWTVSNQGLNLSYVEDLALFDGDSRKVLAATLGGIFQTLDAGGHWTPSNKGMERRVAYRLRINERSPRFVLAGTTDAGVFRSTDGGESWNPSETSFGEDSWISSLCWDPNDAAVAFAGTASRRIYKTTDQGVHWFATSFSSSFRVQSIAVDPRNSSSVSATVAAYGGNYHSDDGGETWALSSTDECPGSTLLIDPASPSNWYSLGGCASSDGGVTWHGPVHWPSGLTAGSFDQSDPSTLFVAGAGIYSNVYRSRDGAKTWKTLVSIPSPRPSTSIAVDPRGHQVYLGSQGGGVFDLTIREVHPVVDPLPGRVNRSREH